MVKMSKERRSAGRRAMIAGAAALSVLVIAGGVHAQNDRPVKFILPVATASGVDTIVRSAQPALSKAFGVPVVVENQPGAGGIVGTQALVKSAPDGTTLSFVSNNHVIYPSVYKSLPFAPIRKPEDLYDDEHLNATGGLADVRLTDGERAGQTVRTTLFPITMAGRRLGVRLQPPSMGEHTRALLSDIGFDAAAIERLYTQRAVA